MEIILIIEVVPATTVVFKIDLIVWKFEDLYPYHQEDDRLK